MKSWFATAALAAAATLAAHVPAAAQEAEGPPPFRDPDNVPQHPYTLREDLKAFVTWPKEWEGTDWLKFAGVLAAVNVGYRRDEEIRDDYRNDGEPDYHEVQDALPAVMAFGGMWYAAKVKGDKEARSEVDTMRRAFIVNAITVQVLKVAIRRDRPATPDVPKDGWFGHEDLSFPSGHTAAAFAIGTVLAESGSDERRALRRTLGYGIGLYTAYQRVNHDTQWFSDTVAGAAIGIAAANVVMRRRREAEPFGHLGIAPMDGGLRLSYTVPLR